MRFVTALLIAAFAAPAAAQGLPPASDPIGALLARPSPPAADPEEPDTAAEPAAATPEPEVAVPAAPLPYAPARPRLTAPVFVNETGKTPDAPPSVRDLAYESRIRASFASAQSFQGPLDGGWTLSAADGTPLFGLQLVDRADDLGGAWRDLRRAGALDGSGMVDEIRRDGGRLNLRFGGLSGTFTGGSGGQWTGQLSDGRAVTLRKAPPQP